MTARRSRQHPCYFPILLSYGCNYTKSLVIPSKWIQLWLKINFRDIRKEKKKSGKTSASGFPFAGDNQPAAPESFAVRQKPDHDSFLEPLVM